MKNLLFGTLLLCFTSIVSGKTNSAFGFATGNKSQTTDNNTLKPGYGFNFNIDYGADQTISLAPGITMFLPFEADNSLLYLLKGNADLHLNLSQDRNYNMYFLAGLAYSYANYINLGTNAENDHGLGTQIGVGFRIKKLKIEIRKDSFWEQLEIVVAFSTY